MWQHNKMRTMQQVQKRCLKAHNAASTEALYESTQFSK
jgi:hypothetical protein